MKQISDAGVQRATSLCTLNLNIRQDKRWRRDKRNKEELEFMTERDRGFAEC